MKIRKVLALVFALLLVTVLFAGCGASSKYDAPAADAPAADAPMEAPSFESDALTDSAQSDMSSMPTDRKLIVTVNMEAETEDLDAMLVHVNSKITALNGYMESQEIYNGSAYSNYRHRNASMTIRIPAENLNKFVDMVAENCNIISNYRTSEDVTLTYVSVESRITALEVEQERLLSLLEKADNMEDLLTIEARLTEVRYELEQMESQMRVMENQINYSTIHLYVNEVIEYTEQEKEPETVWERISSGFAKSLKNVGKGFVNFFVGIVVALPYLIPWGVFALIVVLIVLRIKRRRAKRRSAQQENQQNP